MIKSDNASTKTEEEPRDFLELLGMVRKMIECPKCHTIAPNRKNYYCKNAHPVCQDCYDHKKTPKRCSNGNCAYDRHARRDKLTETLIDGIDFKYQCRWGGCHYSGTRDSLKQHGPNCMFRVVGCPMFDCRVRPTVTDMMAHCKVIHKHVKAGLAFLVESKESPGVFQGKIKIPPPPYYGQTFSSLFEYNGKVYVLRQYFRPDGINAWVCHSGKKEDADKMKAIIQFSGNRAMCKCEVKVGLIDDIKAEAGKDLFNLSPKMMEKMTNGNLRAAKGNRTVDYQVTMTN